MSGIVGILNRNGAPAERALLQALAHFLSYRGPDARDVWSDGPVGFGHTLLRTTRESLNEHQPAGLEGHLWITADARLDCRTELLDKLHKEARKNERLTSDSELILEAYAVWGEGCLEHLRGDFAFGIWDRRQKTLFCARDQLGVKPFYYADPSDLFLFSNTLNCLRAHPEVSEELNESAIADFLLFGLNYDNSTTTFRDIRRLPPAHFLSVSPEGLRIVRYWSAPTDGRIRYHHTDEYVEHFQFLLEAAVRDRLRTDRAGILLSGGLDSASIAATARELSTRPEGAQDLRAYTIVYDSLIPDQDPQHARTVAEFFRIPIRCLAVDDLEPFGRWDDPGLSLPEPVDDPFFAGLFDQFRMIAPDCRVALSGQGGDDLMRFEMWPYARDLMRNRDWKRILAEFSLYARFRSTPWPGIRRRAKRFFSKDPEAPVLPRWVAPDFARRANVEARWKERIGLRTAKEHPILPKAYASLALPQWTQLFELEDPGVTHCPVEVRYPFLDLRIVSYLFALPPFPWFFEKKLLREAMVGRLPESIRIRPKSPLAGDPLVEHLRKPGAEWLNQVNWCEEMDYYIDRSSLPPLPGEESSEQARSNVRPLCLNFWLQSARRVRYNIHAEACNG